MNNIGSYAVLAIIALLLIFLNRMLGVPQQIRLSKDLAELKKRGPVSSVGVAKSFTSGMRIAVLITDREGNILEAYNVKGRSVFAGYELDSDFPYKTCYEVKEELEAKENLSFQEQAYLEAAKYLVKGLGGAKESD
ncbi:MAG: hypothetical protein J6N21_20700 [Butyrivibrio sp.]|nr:hypothetical protein [Butyrivibrio sp.]